MTVEVGLGLILAHFVGDYLIQSQWMAQEKVKRWWPAVVHGVTYTLPFLFVTQSILALEIICVTHILIDRFRLAKHLMWLKNLVGPKAFRVTWAEARENSGYAKSVPVWMSTWLMIVADNTVHIVINFAAIYLTLSL